MSARNIIKAACVRSGITIGEMCGRAAIPEATYHRRVSAGKLTIKDLNAISRVLYLPDAELVELIRGK